MNVSFLIKIFTPKLRKEICKVVKLYCVNTLRSTIIKFRQKNMKKIDYNQIKRDPLWFDKSKITL